GTAATTGTVPGAPPETTAAYTALDCAQPDQATGAATAAAARPDAPAPACLQADGSSPTAEALLLGPSELTGQDLKSATSAFSQQGTGTWEVNLEFTSAGADRFGDITGRLAAGESPANRFAILLDGRVVTAPTVMQQLLGGKAVITGTFTKAEATRLAALLSSGTLPIPLTVASTTTS
ncbi:MAG TPA: protein translocase subunit SecD, partial [Yinghuangia sp.]|nr:protein translocase subunit SecD [Yinghuangia sp.]